MDREELLAETSDNRQTEGCGAYDHETGYCKDTNKPCNMCFIYEKFSNRIIENDRFKIPDDILSMSIDDIRIAKEKLYKKNNKQQGCERRCGKY